MVQSLPQSDGFRILFNSPELSEVQRSGFHLFLKKGIAEELSKISCIQLKDAHFLIEIVLDAHNFRLVPPENNYRDCILKMKSYTCKLYVQTKILFKDKVSGELLYQTQPEWVLLADLPIMTKRGHFVINGSPRVIVHQVGRAPGVYFKKVSALKKDVNSKARFYGDIIPRKGVWVRLQINKKGEIDLKLKKSKKVRAEMVQKCLELLEKSRSKPILFKRHKAVTSLNNTNQNTVPVSGYRFNPGILKQSIYLQSSPFMLKEYVLAPLVRVPKQNFGIKSVLPCSIDLQSNHTKIPCALTQKQLFFSPQSSHLAGIDINNCFDSQTRQTQAFVIGFSINKPQTVVHSIWYHARPWLKSIKGTPTRIRMKPQFQKTFGFNKSIFAQPAPFFPKHVVKTRFALLHAKQLSKPSWNSRTKTECVHTANGAKRLEFMSNNKLAKTSQPFQHKSNNYNLISLLKQPSLCLVKKPSLPFGAKMYGKTRSSFTKAEKQAFTDVYTSFYKNDIQDIKSRVSMSLGNQAKDVPKLDSLNSSLRSVSKLSTQSKSQSFQKVAKKKVAKKPDVSIHLEKVRDYVCQLFKRSDLYDLGTVGREKINNKFGISVIETQLTALDIKSTINWLEKLRAGKEDIDDIDHSQNRRVRTSSELIQIQFSVGITRLKNVITKKVRNGRIEQIKTLPLQKQSLYVKSRAQLIRAPQPSFGKVEVAKNLSVPNKVVPKLASVQTNLSRLQNKSIKTTLFGRSHFNGGGGCFVKRNTLLDQVKCHLQNRTTFTSINPYCITHQKKKKYYSALSFSQFTRKRSHFIHAKPWVRKNEGKQKRRYGWRIDKAMLGTSGNSFVNGNQKTRTGVPTDLAAQNVSHPQTNQLFNFSVSELFSTKPINGALREFFSSSALSQYMDQTNPLAEITHKRRISSLGVGGVSRESAGMAIRGIHPTHYGRICPIETPEGKNAGLVNSLAFYAKINNQGFIETPYYQVLKGQIQHELGFSFVSAGEESQNGFYIAPNDITQSQSKLLANNISTLESIPVRVADNILDLFKKVSPYKVDCIGISPVQILSVATSLIPFLEHNDANRALMGSNMQRQAVSLMISERPLVGTGLEARVLAESGHLVQSKVSGFVSSVSAHKVVVERLLQNLTWSPTLTSSSNFTDLSSLFDKGICQPPYHACLAKSAFNALQRQRQKQKQRLPEQVKRLSTLLERGDSQRSLRMPSISTFGKAKQWSVRESSLEKGKAATYLSMFRYDQSNGVTDTLVLPTQSKKSRAFSLIKKRFALLPVTHSISTFSRSNQETCLIQKPLVKEGDWVQKGDMLSDCSAGQKGELSVGKNMLIAYIPWQGYNFEDAIVISDRLVKEQLYTSLHIERYTVVVNDFKDKVVDTNEWFTGKLPGVDSHKKNHLQKSGLPIIGTILREGDILVGKIKYSKKKPATPHEKLVCDILGEHNFSVQNSSLYVPKGVHEARVLTYKISQRFEKALQNNCRPAGAPKVVHLFLGEKRNIQVGDKMSGRHGNKGIVSSILPKQDMPYLADGSPIDILLNPLGVPSRMNVGQVFECLLGLASTYLHQNFKVTSFDEAYGVEASQSLVFLKLYQARLQSGQNWLFQVNFPGKTRLTDGRSGECLDQWITVGRAYMLKLIHMVNEKIHARAIGPYALVTQQPLKGRAHKGGQRLGEMEVWAVEGFGAAYILQELLTKKSDDSIGRKEVLKAMLPKSASFLDFFDPFDQSIQTENPLGLSNVEKEENRVHNQSQPFNVLGQPDIFKVLICELQALCLDVGVYSMKTESFQRQFLGILE